MSPYKTLSTTLRFPGSHVVYRGWNAISRVDVVEGDGIHSAPGLSLVYRGKLPPQLGLTVDGSNLSPITRRASTEDERFVDYLPASLAYELRPTGRVLVIGPRGGLAPLHDDHGDDRSDGRTHPDHGPLLRPVAAVLQPEGRLPDAAEEAVRAG